MNASRVAEFPKPHLLTTTTRDGMLLACWSKLCNSFVTVMTNVVGFVCRDDRGTTGGKLQWGFDGVSLYLGLRRDINLLASENRFQRCARASWATNP